MKGLIKGERMQHIEEDDSSSEEGNKPLYRVV